MEETGFGVLEDKVVKNYIATEFLYDYLKDKRSVGVIDEDPERGDPVRRRADRRRARAAADHQPDVDGAVQGDRRRQDAQRDDLPPVGARGALRAARRRAAPGGRRGGRACRPTRCRSCPTRRSTPRSTSSTTPASTSSGRPAARRPSRRPTRRASRASASGPATRRSTCTRSADIPMAVVDILISKTFDASVICPAEQTLVVDDAIYDERRRRARAHGRAGARRPSEVDALAALAFDEDGRARHGGARALVRRPRRRWPASTADDARQGAPRAAARPTSTSSPRIRSCTRSSCRCSGSCARRRSSTASPPASWSPSTAASATRPASTRPTRPSSTRFAERDPHRPHPRQRADRGRRAGRHLQRDDADLLARLRHVGRVDDDRQRQLPQPAQHQGGLAPPDPAAVVPRARRTPTSTPARSRACARCAREPRSLIVTDARHRGARRRRRGAPPPGRRQRARLHRRRSPSRPRSRCAPASRCSATRRPT